LRSNLKSVTVTSLLLISVAFSPVSVSADDPKNEFYPAKVRDISDRAYEPTVIGLLDNAKESIVMSMYIVNVQEKGPVRLLVNDLEEALDRGVSVEIYVNTHIERGATTYSDIERPLEHLTKKGGKIYKFSSSYRLHDKLIIVDSRYVVDGSMNWSVSAIKSNYESAVLIDSPELAKVKLMRLRTFPLEGDPKEEKPRPDRPKSLEPLPAGTVVSVSNELLANRRYFPEMLRQSADRDMNAYLLLLAESVRLGRKEFFIVLEDMAVSLGMSPGWSDTALRRQMIKDLRVLQDKYGLIDVDFSYGKDAWVELAELTGPSFNVDGAFLDPKNLVSKSHPAKYVSLIKALLESEGSSLDSVPVSELSKRFGISIFSIRKGMKEIGSSR
jgi:hypothetical protein